MRACMQSGLKYGSVQVLVCADLCRHFVQQPPAGLRSLAELQSLSAARASQLFGSKPAEWSVVADWSLVRPFVCAAMPAALLQALQQAAAELSLSLTVESAVLAALERVMPLAPAEGFMGWVTPRAAVLAHVGPLGVTALRCLRRAADLATADLMALLAREVVQEGLRANLQGRALHLVNAGLSADVGQGAEAVQVRSLDAPAALPASLERDTEAAWASRLAALASAQA